jgi:hypothetical protein
MYDDDDDDDDDDDYVQLYMTTKNQRRDRYDPLWEFPFTNYEGLFGRS